MMQVDQDQIDRLVCEIKSLEEQLAQLRAKVQNLGRPGKPHTVGDLRGLLHSVANSTEAEIDASLLRLKPESDAEVEESRK